MYHPSHLCTPLITEDMQIAANFAAGRLALEARIEAALARGLTRICLVETTSQEGPSARAFISTMAVLRRRYRGRITLYAGLKADFLDNSGLLDLPDAYEAADLLFAGHSRFPMGSHSFRPETIQTMLNEGRTSPPTIVAHLIHAMMGAMQHYPQVVIPSPFYLLQRVGLSEADIPMGMLQILADCARQERGIFEINEASQCPSYDLVYFLERHGVELLMSTGAETPSAVGHYAYGAAVLDTLLEQVIETP